MYPGDEQTHNQNTMPAPPQPTMYGTQPAMPGAPQPPQKPHNSNNGTLLPWIISGVLFLICLILMVLLIVALANNKQNNNAATNSTGQTSSNTNACSNNQRRYKNTSLGVGFCYPTIWGDVLVANAKYDPTDNGTRERLSFSAKSQVHLGLVSDDWSSSINKPQACADPSAQAFPDTSTFSAKWVTQGTGNNVTSALRGLEVNPGTYLIQETTDSQTVNGACLQGYVVINGNTFRNAAASYYVPFGNGITTPAAHINNPTSLISPSDRSDFAAFVKSIYSL